MPKKIVVIDDCNLTRAIISDMLQEAGYVVATADSGMSANIHIYTTPPPDLIIIDVEMPQLKGDFKVKLLKKRKESANIPILLISAKSESVLNKLAHDSGADGYLSKPLDKKVVLATIGSVLNLTDDPLD